MHVSVNDKNNDDILGFSIGKLGLCFHKTIDTFRYVTGGPDVVLSQAGRMVRCAAQSSDKKNWEKLPSAFSIQSQNNICVFVRRAAVWKATFVIQTNSQSINLAELIVSLTVT